jgi:hypothetical protein
MVTEIAVVIAVNDAQGEGRGTEAETKAEREIRVTGIVVTEIEVTGTETGTSADRGPRRDGEGRGRGTDHEGHGHPGKRRTSRDAAERTTRRGVAVREESGRGTGTETGGFVQKQLNLSIYLFIPQSINSYPYSQKQDLIFWSSWFLS